jgi:hypothetical protein
VDECKPLPPVACFGEGAPNRSICAARGRRSSGPCTSPRRPPRGAGSAPAQTAAWFAPARCSDEGRKQRDIQSPDSVDGSADSHKCHSPIRGRGSDRGTTRGATAVILFAGRGEHEGQTSPLALTSETRVNVSRLPVARVVISRMPGRPWNWSPQTSGVALARVVPRPPRAFGAALVHRVRCH